MTWAGPPPAWLAAARAQAHQPLPAARLPLLLGEEPIGSVAPGLLDEIARQPASLAGTQLSKVECGGRPAWRLYGAPGTAALDALAHALRRAARCGPWRGEQVAVRAPDGRLLASVERGALRVLGVATQAVHLVGGAAGGARLWVQQRAHTKPTHPLAWDTLVGGMVAAGDDLDGALARETWEEAGLRLAQLPGLRAGGQVRLARPCDDGGPGCGWMDETIAWFHAAVPAQLQPANQDGEVQAFACLEHPRVQALLAAGAFTPEAALVLAQFYGW